MGGRASTGTGCWTSKPAFHSREAVPHRRRRTCPFFLFTRPSFTPSSSSIQAVQKKYCQCELTAVLKIVKKEGANQGRHYWSCPNSQAAACNFFEWEDDPASAVTVAPLNARTQSAGSQQTTGECFNVSAIKPSPR